MISNKKKKLRRRIGAYLVYIVHVLIAFQQSIRQRLSSDQIYRWSIPFPISTFFFLSLDWSIFSSLSIWPSSPMIQRYCSTISRWRIGDCIRGASVERSGCICEPDDDGLIALFPFATFLTGPLLLSWKKKMCWFDWFLDFITISENFPTKSSLQHIYVLKTSTGKKKTRCQELLCFALYEWLVNKRWYWFSKKLLFMVC